MYDPQGPLLPSSCGNLDAQEILRGGSRFDPWTLRLTWKSGCYREVRWRRLPRDSSNEVIRWEEMSDCFPKVQSGKHLFAAAHSDALALRRRDLLDASVHREFLRALAATLRTPTSLGGAVAQGFVATSRIIGRECPP